MMQQQLIASYCKLLLPAFAFASLIACNNNEAAVESIPAEPVTSVTVTGISTGKAEDAVDLNATSAFLLRTDVKANTTGYLQSANISVGQLVRKGQLLFSVTTKEAKSLGNIINELDSSFHFSGTLQIHANASGYITQLNKQTGDYVQEGESLATISDINSFAFLLNLPYELKPYIQLNKTVTLQLPDGKILEGAVSASMPSMDSASQTQAIVIKIKNTTEIPENLIAKVHIIKSVKNNAVMLPKQAVLSDETQTQFWVMKITDSTAAAKVPVSKGLETGSLIEIIAPLFTTTDRFVLTGNYGLPDTAKIIITNTK